MSTFKVLPNTVHTQIIHRKRVAGASVVKGLNPLSPDVVYFTSQNAQ